MEKPVQIVKYILNERDELFNFHFSLVFYTFVSFSVEENVLLHQKKLRKKCLE